MVWGTSGFHTGLGVLTRCWVQHLVNPATADPHAPGRVHVRDHIILKLEGGVGGIIGIGIVGLAVLVHPLRDMRRAKAAYGLHPAEEIVEDITPVAEHIEN